MQDQIASLRGSPEQHTRTSADNAGATTALSQEVQTMRRQIASLSESSEQHTRMSADNARAITALQSRPTILPGKFIVSPKSPNSAYTMPDELTITTAQDKLFIHGNRLNALDRRYLALDARLNAHDTARARDGRDMRALFALYDVPVVDIN